MGLGMGSITKGNHGKRDEKNVYRYIQEKNIIYREKKGSMDGWVDGEREREKRESRE